MKNVKTSVENTCATDGTKKKLDNQESQMKVQAIKTRLFKENENLADFIVDQVSTELIHESMILAVTSKIVSLAEGELVEKSKIAKEDLIRQESDVFLGAVGYGCYLTIKHGLFIASAGVDESNSAHDCYILYPENPFLSVQILWKELRQRWKLKQLGIIMTDSHTTLLRRGVTGIALAYWGIRGVESRIGQPDLFGRPLQMTTVNVVDALAAAATLLMGEANESRPLAALRCSGVEFTESTIPEEVVMPLEEDLYYPFLKSLL